MSTNLQLHLLRKAEQYVATSSQLAYMFDLVSSGAKSGYKPVIRKGQLTADNWFIYATLVISRADVENDLYASNVLNALMGKREYFDIHYDRAFDDVFNKPLYSMSLDGYEVLNSLTSEDFESELERYLRNVKAGMGNLKHEASIDRCFDLYDMLRAIELLHKTHYVVLSFA